MNNKIIDDYPETWQEFIANFTDIGTTWNGKGGVFVPIDRVHKMVEHYFERTCKMERAKLFPEYEDCVFECWECSACKRTNEEQRPMYCPSCGARVVK